MSKINKKFLFQFALLFVLIFSQAIAQGGLDDIVSKNDELAKEYLDDGNKAEAARLYNQTAYEFRKARKYNKSIEYYKKVLKLNEELGNTVGQKLTHSNLSMLLIETQRYKEALNHLEAELNFRQRSKKPREIIPVLVSIAGVKNELQNFESALETAKHAINMSKEAGDLEMLKRSLGITFDIYTKWGKQSEAQTYFEQYSAIDKKIKELKMVEVKTEAVAQVNEANIEKARTQEELNVTSMELEKTAVSLEVAERIAREQQLEIDLQQAQIAEKEALLKITELKQRFFAWAFAIATVFVLILIFLVLRIRKANKEINDQRLKLEKQNREIRSSIRYAKTIQSAMLPALEHIDKFASHFVIYRPKDIVSGDFYWSTEVNENRMFYAVVDCTGHGVPGAFMSMIGIRMLNEIVTEMKIDSPAVILETLNELLREALRQEQTDNNDGMDLAIIRIDKKTDGNAEVIYSGAKRPLYVGRKSKHDLDIYNPDRKSIGGYQPTKRYIEFTDHKVAINKGDVLYIFSDGIVDQNDPYRKKFGRARLESILKSCIDSDADRQQRIIEGKLDEFIQNEAQRDDITFSGLIIN